ncbi:MAG: c-type cytochrome [Candidatus Methylomirabilis oxyfera]|nr:c-type cytochrome [Candidatus Methylomirabilis oxyfera]
MSRWRLETQGFKFTFSRVSGLVSLVCLLSVGETALTQEKPTPEAIAKGKAIYVKWCSFCHGLEGKGNGPAADYLNPRPRDFTIGSYKLRTTNSGEAPTDEDLFQTISRGITGTAMQGFEGVLTEEERRQVIAFIKTFTPDRFEVPPERVEIGSEKSGSIEKGKEVYHQKAKCWECHGKEGRGDGPGAANLKDDWDFPLFPANLTKGWRYKGGTSVRDIFTRFTTGMDGTPMPTFTDTLREEDRWNLAAYVRSLIKEEKGGADVVVHAKRIDQELSLDPNDPLWQEAKPRDIPLSGQVIVAPRWQNPSVDQITVRSLFNDKAIGFLLEWDDRFKDTVHKEEPLPPAKDTYAKVLPEKKWTLRDAVAIQFPVKIPGGLERPYFFLGEPSKPVVLWHWKADGNEDPKRRTPVEVLRATGPKNPLTPFLDEGQVVMGKGMWKNGRWKVVMMRPLAAKDKEKDIAFEVGRLIPIAFYAWDGSNGEQELLMSLSSWFYLIPEAPTPPAVYLYAFLAILGGFCAELLLVRWARSCPIALGPESVVEPAGA